MTYHGTGRRKIAGLLVISLLSALLSAVGIHYNWLQELESRTWDWRLRLSAPAVPHDPQIKIIAVDQAALDSRAADQVVWPWPRSMYVPVLKYLELSGAAGVAFDIIFSEGGCYQVTDDRAFAEAVAQSSIPVISSVVASPNPPKQTIDTPLEFKRKIELNTEQSHFDRRYLAHPRTPQANSMVLPIPELLSASAGFGAVTQQPDSDGVFRHILPGVKYRDLPILALPFALYERITPAGEQREITPFLDQEGRAALRFPGAAHTYQTISIDAVIESYRRVTEHAADPPPVPLELFKDAAVFIGLTAPGLMDLRATPLDARLSGVEYNAAALDNLRHGHFAKKLGLAPALLAVILALLCLNAAILFSRNTMGALFWALLIFAAMLGGAGLFAGYGIWMPLLWPLLSMVGAMLAALRLQYQLEGRQLQFIRNAFRHYVSPDVIEKISADPTALSLGGEKRELTIFFSDIANFSSISERLDPAKLAKLLNRYLEAMTTVILEHRGTLDKYIGDGIVAFWNAPIDVPNHPSLAVQAALECQARLKALNPDFEADFGTALKTRIGIHTDSASVGNFGSQSRFDYTVMGDAANLASRLEGVNKVFGTEILASENCIQGCSGIHARRIGAVRVVGRAESIAVYEPLGAASGDTFSRALACFEAGEFAKAAQLFSSLARDPVAQAYLKRIQSEQPAASGWSAVWILTNK
ncbi:MAG: adenylate/guanylate cyclase domain-containing protein [Oligoflexia bacterium]|nr:adenylate/guanylate cyclase domain-containing protein [Oligoflexia bacterium]